MQADCICASAWQDRKIVTIMYNGFNPLEITTVLRRNKDGSRTSIPCPSACAAYNQHMGGVDRGDQLRGYYLPKIKSRKFYKYIANFLFGVALTNSFILLKISHPNVKTTLKQFQELLATQLIGEYCSRKKAGRVSHLMKPLPILHFPAKKQSTINSERKRGRCSLYWERNHRSDTQWFCNECGVWLCHPGTLDDCFLLWHKRRV